MRSVYTEAADALMYRGLIFDQGVGSSRSSAPSSSSVSK